MPKVAIIVFLSVLLFSSVYASMPLGSTSQGEESPGNTGQAKVVTSVGFVGNRHYKDKVLQQRVDIKKGSRLDPVLIEAGRRTIIEIYRKVGFAFVKVTVDFAKFSAGEVVYTIDEGPRVRITSVNFSGNEAIKTAILRN